MTEISDTENNDDATRIKTPDPIADLATKPISSATLPQTQVFAEETKPGTDSYGNDFPPADFQLVIGSVIKGTFELVSVLGEGGMGTVFKALNKVWAEVEARDPYVAIKVLKPELSANKQLVRSLYSDFDRTKMLADCPNIIKAYGFDRDGPHVYMTMEYLSGQTLNSYLNGTALSLEQAWFIIEGIGNALAYAHKNNIVHRDIKPGNIIITDEGVVKVLDFGIASKINETEGDETKFGGHELGALTVAYASPEMQRDYSPDARDDIFSFACVIYEVLTGKQFFKQKIHKPEPIKGLNSRQMEVLNKSLAFERDQRTSSVNELLEKLRPVKMPWSAYLKVAGGLILGVGLVLLIIKISVIQPGAEQKFSSQNTQTVAEPPRPSPPTPVVQEIKASEPPIVKSEPTPPPLSKNDVVSIKTSKPDYKNGESFQLSFTLTQAMYVRVIDRDAKGVVTVLRPNPQQPDKLLTAGKVYSFPPEGFKVPVQGPAGESTVTVIASTQPFSKKIRLLNDDGNVSNEVQNGEYSWTQTRYTLHP